MVRTVGRSFGVRSRDCQIFREWVDLLSYGAPPTRAHVGLRYNLNWKKGFRNVLSTSFHIKQIWAYPKLEHGSQLNSTTKSEYIRLQHTWIVSCSPSLGFFQSHLSHFLKNKLSWVLKYPLNIFRNYSKPFTLFFSLKSSFGFLVPFYSFWRYRF